MENNGKNGALTEREVLLILRVIRKNKEVIDDYIHRIDLFVNQEKYPSDEIFIIELRKRLYLLMEENDTFRKVFWKHEQMEVFVPCPLCPQ